jgi:hypothetical protein
VIGNAVKVMRIATGEETEELETGPRAPLLNSEAEAERREPLGYLQHDAGRSLRKQLALDGK